MLAFNSPLEAGGWASSFFPSCLFYLPSLAFPSIIFARHLVFTLAFSLTLYLLKDQLRIPSFSHLDFFTIVTSRIVCLRPVR